MPPRDTTSPTKKKRKLHDTSADKDDGSLSNTITKGRDKGQDRTSHNNESSLPKNDFEKEQQLKGKESTPTASNEANERATRNDPKSEKEQSIDNLETLIQTLNNLKGLGAIRKIKDTTKNLGLDALNSILKSNVKDNVKRVIGELVERLEQKKNLQEGNVTTYKNVVNSSVDFLHETLDEDEKKFLGKMMLEQQVKQLNYWANRNHETIEPSTLSFFDRQALVARELSVSNQFFKEEVNEIVGGNLNVGQLDSSWKRAESKLYQTVKRVKNWSEVVNELTIAGFDDLDRNNIPDMEVYRTLGTEKIAEFQNASIPQSLTISDFDVPRSYTRTIEFARDYAKDKDSQIIVKKIIKPNSLVLPTSLPITISKKLGAEKGTLPNQKLDLDNREIGWNQNEVEVVVFDNMGPIEYISSSPESEGQQIHYYKTKGEIRDG